MAADELMPTHKSHRNPKSGPTMKKKSENDKKKRGVPDNKQQNPRVTPSQSLERLLEFSWVTSNSWLLLDSAGV